MPQRISVDQRRKASLYTVDRWSSWKSMSYMCIIADMTRSPVKARAKPQIRRNKPVTTATRPRKSLTAMMTEKMGEASSRGGGTRTSPFEIESEAEAKNQPGPSRSSPPEISKSRFWEGLR